MADSCVHIRGYITIVFCIAALGQTASSSATEPPISTLAHDKLNGIRRILDDIMQRQELVGLQATVYFRGKVITNEYRGFADLEHRVPVSPTTRFPIASSNKEFTGVSLLRLAEKGKLDLDAPIQSYVSEFPTKPEGAITARLLGHCLSGIRHYRDDERDMNWYSQHFLTARGSLKLFKDDPLVAVPGSSFTYSSYGYNLLAAAIESVTSRRFDQYVIESICKPVGMKHTEFEDV